MSGTLSGVIVGGIIASVNPILQLIYNHRQTRRQEKLSFLKDERRNREEKVKKFVELLRDSLETETVSVEFSSEILYHMPEKIRDMYVGYINDQTSEKKLHLLYDISHELHSQLADLDNQIKKFHKIDPIA